MHIRIEHQLKLHIESTEDRIEELERELDITSQGTIKRKRASSEDASSSGLNDAQASKFKAQGDKIKALTEEVTTLKKQLQDLK